MPSSEHLWFTPLILLPGVALLIVSTSARFGQIHAEFHHLLDHSDAHSEILARHLVQRSELFRNALLGLYSSVAFFALGALLGGIATYLFPQALWLVGGITLVGISALVYAAVQLMREARICLDVIHQHQERVGER